MSVIQELKDNEVKRYHFVLGVKQYTDNWTKFDGTTLAGYITVTDSKGRVVSEDPNYCWSHIKYEDEIFTVIKKGWQIKIFSGKKGYMYFQTERSLIYEEDIKPDYVKEYEKSKRKVSIFKRHAQLRSKKREIKRLLDSLDNRVPPETQDYIQEKEWLNRYLNRLNGIKVE
jgi:hypothetical protein